CREFRVSRKVVRKVIRSRATEFRYERGRQPLPRIDPWRDQLDGLLLENRGKPARERLTLIRIFEELRVLGYEGSYDAIRRYAKRWRAEHGAATVEVFVPLSFAPGEAYQFDWSHEIVLINGVTVTVKVAHVRLCRGCGWRATKSSMPGCSIDVSPTPKRTSIPSWPTARSGRLSRRSGRSSCRLPGHSTGSTRHKRRSRRPAWYASTTTSTRSPRVRSAGQSRSRLMPIAL